MLHHSGSLHEILRKEMQCSKKTDYILSGEVKDE